MNPKSRVEILNTYFRSQLKSQSAKPDPQKEPPRRLFVTISRQSGTGAVEVGEELVRILNETDSVRGSCLWTLFDENLIDLVLKKHDLPGEFSKYMGEKDVNTIRDIVEETLGLHPSSATLARKTSQVILHLAQMGQAVIVGRGSNALTRKLGGGLHIRLIGSRESRIANLMKEQDIDRKKAAARMEKEDAEREEYARKHFRADITDPLMHHCLINMSCVSRDWGARMIADTVIHMAKGEA